MDENLNNEPNKKLQVYRSSKRKKSNPKTEKSTAKEFRSQFPDDIGLPEISHVKDLVKNSGDSGRLFELNFLVLFNTIMGIGKDDTRIKVSCLQKTKLKWNGYQHYNGPLTFLL
ncbi:hypothetical protein R6Q59_009714, partial [Mikania micrantha]